MIKSPYYKNTLRYKFYGRSFEFAVSQELFSSVGIDRGTELLLRTIAEARYQGITSVLDIGSGYGALGISLAALYPNVSLAMVDRDRLAVEFSEYNMNQNKVSGESYASLGFDSVPQQSYDLIVSNLPGKAGVSVLEDLLSSVRYFSHENTVAAIVVVSPIADAIGKFLNQSDELTILLRKDTKAYTVFHFRCDGVRYDAQAEYKPAFERGIYNRAILKNSEYDIKLQTVYGLPEFDSLHFKTKLLLGVINKNPKDIIDRKVGVWNPAQGFIPVTLSRYKPERIVIISRDLLSLINTQRNLNSNDLSCLMQHSSQPAINDLETLIISLHERENIKVIAECVSKLKPGQCVYLVGKNSQVHQVTQLLRKDKPRVSYVDIDHKYGQKCLKIIT